MNPKKVEIKIKKLYVCDFATQKPYTKKLLLN